MKNKFLLALAVAGSMLTSCNMDLNPAGTITDSESMLTLLDAQKFRNAFYSSFRGFSTSGYIGYPSVQADEFNGLIVNGNFYGPIASGSIQSNLDDIESVWAGLNSRIANINFFMQNVGSLRDKYLEEGDEESVIALDYYIGEARFFRGFYLAEMFDRFCVEYNAADGDKEGMGCPIDTIYDPTPIRSKYVGRSSMNKTIAFIDHEFSEALRCLENWEPLMKEIYPSTNANYTLKANAIYLSSYTVKAMMARWNFMIGRYAQAITLAKEVIESGIYPLVSTAASYKAMWTTDQGTEILFSPYMSTSELGGALGAYFLNNESGAWYIPSSKLIEEYQASGRILRDWADIRYAAFIGTASVNSAFGAITVPAFIKFPGNSSLQTGSNNNYVNKPKPFRTSEMYLIIAEASNLLNDPGTANQYLNDFKKARVLGYKDTTLAGNALTNEIRRQRSLEFVGEGFRLSDLRRWKQGFSRREGANYGSTDVEQLLTENYLNVVYTGTDYRYTWPIPSAELQVNPQMANQQNPGY